MGRHKHIDVLLAMQSSAHIPKHLIRDNANILVLFQQDETNLKRVYLDDVNSDMKFSTSKIEEKNFRSIISYQKQICPMSLDSTPFVVENVTTACLLCFFFSLHFCSGAFKKNMLSSGRSNMYDDLMNMMIFFHPV